MRLIIVLSTQIDRAPNDPTRAAVRCLFRTPVPAGQRRPLAGGSVAPNATEAEHVEVRTGAVIEAAQTAPFTLGAGQAAIKAALEARWQAWQTATLAALPPPPGAFYLAAWDGTAWTV